MKFFTEIIILVFITLASAGPIAEKQNFQKMIDDCAKKFNITLSEFGKAIEEKKLPYDNTTGHCFVKCCFENIGIFDKDNGVNVKFLEFIIADNPGFSDDAAVYMPILRKCAKKENHGDNGCERAYRVVECSFNGILENYLESHLYKRYETECGKEFQIPASDLKKFNMFKSTDNNPKLHCYIKCRYEKMGGIENNNSFNVDKIYNEYAGGPKIDPSGELRAKIAKCTEDTLQGANDCERAFHVIECISDEMDKWFEMRDAQEASTAFPVQSVQASTPLSVQAVQA